MAGIEAATIIRVYEDEDGKPGRLVDEVHVPPGGTIPRRTKGGHYWFTVIQVPSLAATERPL